MNSKSDEAVIINCARCEARLDAADLQPDDLLRCANCGEIFEFPTAEAKKSGVSRKAIFSLLLGIAALVFSLLAAIPAVALGIAALRDIKKHKALRGRSLAISGIGSGILFSLTCGLCWTGFAVMLNSLQPTYDAAEIRQMSDEMMQLDLPRGVGPQSAATIFGMKEFQYRGRSSATHISFQFSPKSRMPQNATLRESLRTARIGDVKTETKLIDKPMRVTKQIVISANQQTVRRYFAVEDAGQYWVSIVVTVRQYEQAHNVQPLSDKEVIDFYSSLEIVDQ